MDQVNQEEVTINPKGKHFAFAVEDIDLAFDTIDNEVNYTQGAIVAPDHYRTEKLTNKYQTDVSL